MAIAITPVWNHLIEKTIEPGETIDMPQEMIDSLIQIGAAKEVDAPEAEPTKASKPRKTGIVEGDRSERSE